VQHLAAEAFEAGRSHRAVEAARGGDDRVERLAVDRPAGLDVLDARAEPDPR